MTCFQNFSFANSVEAVMGQSFAQAWQRQRSKVRIAWHRIARVVRSQRWLSPVDHFSKNRQQRGVLVGIIFDFARFRRFSTTTTTTTATTVRCACLIGTVLRIGVVGCTHSGIVVRLCVRVAEVCDVARSRRLWFVVRSNRRKRRR